MINYNIEVENEYKGWNLDLEKISSSIKQIFEYYVSVPEIYDNSCLANYVYEVLNCDFLLTYGQKTHIINKEYRKKDYAADIISFALFADSPESERFIPDFEINLGEVIIALDKIIESASEKNISKEVELVFMISHGIMHLLGFDHQTQADFEFVVKCQKHALESMGIIYDKI